jgi:hypothetical protein
MVKRHQALGGSARAALRLHIFIWRERAAAHKRRQRYPAGARWYGTESWRDAGRHGGSALYYVIAATAGNSAQQKGAAVRRTMLAEKRGGGVKTAPWRRVLEPAMTR